MEQQMTPFKKWMQAQGLTNSAMAERLGVSYILIYKVAEGERNISDGLKWRIAREFGVGAAEEITIQDAPVAQ